MRAAVRRAFFVLGAVGLVAFAATIAPTARSEPPPPTVDPHGGYSSETASCEACHETHEALSASLIALGTEAETCYRCHDGSSGGPDIEAQFERAGSVHPVPDQTLRCGDCHSPHRSVLEDTKLLRVDVDGTLLYSPPDTPIGNQYCYTCHPDYAAFDGSAHNEDHAALGPPSASQIQCLICHQPHGSNEDFLLAEASATLCLTCHDPVPADEPPPESEPAAATGPTGATGSAEGDDEATPVYGFGARANDTTTSDGTPIRIYHHPVSPDEQQDGARAVTCSSCHNPHLADARTAWQSDLLVDPSDTTTTWSVAWRRNAAERTRGTIDEWCATCHLKPRREVPFAPSEAVPSPVRLVFDSALDADGLPHDLFTFEEWTSASPHGPSGAGLACTACHDFHGSTNAAMLREQVTSPDGASTGTVTGYGAVQAHWDRLQAFCLTCHIDTEPEHGQGQLCTRCHAHTSGRL